jgi:predicted DNA-binding transcriptional regulator YafY
MTRADRLMDLADLLRSRETTTVASLAHELEVSERTVLRDLATLRARGLPITGETGRGGGIRLEGDRGITALHLSITEVAAMWLAARLSRETSDLPWSEAARSALAKLLASLPRAKARQLRALCRRVVIGPAASARVRASAKTAPRELLGLFDAAFSNGIGLAFHYTDRDGKPSERRIEPHGLLVESPVWYLLARDLDKLEPRTFRMDRILRPRLLDGVRFRPDLRVVEAQLCDPDRWRPLAAHL